MGQGFIGEILHHAQADGVVELVHAGGVLAVFPAGAAFQDDDRMGGARGDFFGHQEAGKAAAHDHHVDWLEALHIEKTMSHFGRVGYILRFREMRLGMAIPGVLMVLMGGVWFLQGINVLPGSFMPGELRWAVYGGILAAVGIGLLWRARRRS